jgi:hypothetical protein
LLVLPAKSLFERFSSKKAGELLFRDLAILIIFLHPPAQFPKPLSSPQMQLLNTIAYYGPNRWSRLPTLEAYFTVNGLGCNPSFLSNTIKRLHDMAGVVGQAMEPSTGTEGKVVLAFEFEEEKLLIECINLALRLCAESDGKQEIDISLSSSDGRFSG